jgi:nitroreductase
MIRKFKQYILLIYGFFIEAKTFYFLLIKHNASIGTNNNKNKMQYVLLRENHVIEKGMSMKNPRKGFGQEKVLNLLDRLDLYYKTFNDKVFLEHPLSTVKSYIEFIQEQNVEISHIEKKFEELCRKTKSLDIHSMAGIKRVSKLDICKSSKINFSDFVKSRYSTRYFSKEIPELKLINEALIMAQKTPSACNRQAWYTHIYSSKKTTDLLKWQGGANGFEQDIPLSILVTANMNAFLSYEPYQVHVDGGLYAMTLIYALHSLGLGTIPFSTGFQANKIQDLHVEFNLDENEVPILIIGVGCLLDSFNVAVSKRKPIDQTTFYH